MTIDLAKIVFDNDIFVASLPDGSTIILNKVDEDFSSSYGETVVKAINIEKQDIYGNSTVCPFVIGLGNDMIQIKTDYKEYEGDVLTPENMMYCTIEVYE